MALTLLAEQLLHLTYGPLTEGHGWRLYIPDTLGLGR